MLLKLQARKRAFERNPVLDALACSVDDGRDQREAPKPGNADAIEQWLIGKVPRNRGEGFGLARQSGR